MTTVSYLQGSLNLGEKSILNTLELLESGATVPFIARYRKERTLGLDEVQITSIRDGEKKYSDIIARQKTIIKTVEEQGKLTTDFQNNVLGCFDLLELEDLYLPFKQKRETRGEKARKKGIEPLAKMIMSQSSGKPEEMATRFVKDSVKNEAEAISGALDIIAEWMSENAALRKKIRYVFKRKATLTTKLVKGKEEEAQKYKDYFSYEAQYNKIVSHRFLAIARAEKEGYIKYKIQPDIEEVLSVFYRFYVKSNNDCSKLIEEVCKDSYKRLIFPSIQTEFINELKEKSDRAAINIFSTNLRQLLLAPPLGAKRILAIDPGFRTGCKVVCLDESGNLLTNATIYPHPPQKEQDKAKSKLAQLVQAYKIEVIAIGDGTAGRETEFLVKKIHFDRDLEVYSVREDGASIYSASSIARKEFPDYDVTVRGSISIGRRLMDPLAELVKIDPKSVGVGQYQHDVNQTELKTALDDVVISCVNSVGVDLNTASPYLLSYVAGLGPTLAENIVAYRSENGAFKSREDLKKVKRLGDKGFEQAAGFLRIRESENPLDNSAIHPENYKVIEQLAKKKKLNLKDLIANDEVIKGISKEDFPSVDTYTFEDIIKELKKPGRDPRRKAKVLEFDSSIRSLEDLKVGMKLNGIVTNVTAFGAFVNIGIKENGLIHKSNLADVYVEDPAQFITLHEHVNVEVLEVDEARKRIGLKKV
jgi:protein Tex